jgi:hypothetical protein
MDRDEQHARITHFSEQAEQCSLVDNPSADQRIAVFIQCEGQAIKPTGPAAIQVSMDANFVLSILVMLLLEWVCSAHIASLYLPSKNTDKYGEASSLHDVIDVVIDGGK